MSSIHVRTTIENFLKTNIPSENFIDMSSEFSEMADFLAEYGLTLNSNWTGIQFLPSEEIPVSLTATNTKGRYRETGIIYLHVVAPAGINAKNGILNRAEAIRNLLRGQVLGNTIYIEQITPPAFGPGVTLNFESGFTAAVVSLNYRRDMDL